MIHAQYARVFNEAKLAIISFTDLMIPFISCWRNIEAGYGKTRRSRQLHYDRHAVSTSNHWYTQAQDLWFVNHKVLLEMKANRKTRYQVLLYPYYSKHFNMYFQPNSSFIYKHKSSVPTHPLIFLTSYDDSQIMLLSVIPTLWESREPASHSPIPVRFPLYYQCTINPLGIKRNLSSVCLAWEEVTFSSKHGKISW